LRARLLKRAPFKTTAEDIATAEANDVRTTDSIDTTSGQRKEDRLNNINNNINSKNISSEGPIKIIPNNS